MLKSLREMFGPKEVVAAEPADGKITLADVLSRGWFELWYQPKIELRTMRLYGAEALVRARHPQRGVLPPGVFLPGAGEADMLALTERVIVTALKDWNDFAANGLSLKIAVNVPVSALIKLPISAMVREHAADGGKLAGPDPGSDRGRDHRATSSSPTTPPPSCRPRAARWRSTISAPAIPRSRGSSSCRSASSRSTAPM